MSAPLPDLKARQATTAKDARAAIDRISSDTRPDSPSMAVNAPQNESA